MKMIGVIAGVGDVGKEVIVFESRYDHCIFNVRIVRESDPCRVARLEGGLFQAGTPMICQMFNGVRRCSR